MVDSKGNNDVPNHDAEKDGGNVEAVLSETIDGQKEQVSGLARHLETVKTPEEEAAEKRYMRKIDLIILPLLTSMFFLASMVRILL